MSINSSSGAISLSRAAIYTDNVAVTVLGRSVDSESPSGAAESNGNVVSNVNWYYLAGAIDFANATITVYVRDPYRQRIITESVTFGRTITPDTASTSNAIGAAADGSGLFFRGNIDEVRIANGLRTTDWLAAQYKSVTDNDFIIFGEAVDEFDDDD